MRTKILVYLNRGPTMKSLSLSETEMKLSALVESVRDTEEAAVITEEGVPAAVLVSPDEFESWRETMAIRFDPEFMAEVRGPLRAAAAQGKALHSRRAFRGDNSKSHPSGLL